ncbi:MAG: glutamate--tRNA ligase, partial [Gammaproteobacteria bacterium]|nr:glutamate--tRNA ligase [Gammaproteobacteria bacterium]
DHINNTPRQINIFKALGVTPPTYGHLPMILGADGARLSKRHGAVSVMQYRDEGYLPEALLNYLVRLGWSHGDQEIFSKEEMVALFTADKINNSPATFNPEKLLWLNQHYLKTLPPDYIAAKLAWHMQQLGINVDNGPTLVQLVNAQRERCKTLVEIAEQSRYFYQDNIAYDADAKAKHLTADIKAPLESLQQQLAAIADWCPEKIHSAIQNVLAETNLKMGKLGPAVRVAVTGNTNSPSLDITLALLGQKQVLTRLKYAIAS